MKAQRNEPDSDLQRGFEPLRTTFAVLVLLLGFVAAVRADSGFGTIKAMARDGQPFELVALTSEIHYQIGGLIAEASIRQHFTNTGNDWIEAQYLLPLPEGAAVHDMTLRIGERLVVGEIREKEQARREYVEAAASGQRAALVESDRAQLFRTAVANVAPGESIEVEVRWWQPIDYAADRFRLTLPLTYTPRYTSGMSAPGIVTDSPADGNATTRDDMHSTPAPRVELQVELDPGLALSRVESPSHAIQVQRRASAYSIRLASGSVPADRDFVLEWVPILGASPSAAVLTETVDGQTYAMVMLVPDSQLADPLPRELILVMDTSGSMQGESIRQARAALDLALSSLRPIDRFNVIQFNSVTESLFDHAVAASAADVALAREWIAGLQANAVPKWWRRCRRHCRARRRRDTCARWCSPPMGRSTTPGRCTPWSTPGSATRASFRSVSAAPRMRRLSHVPRSRGAAARSSSAVPRTWPSPCANCSTSWIGRRCATSA